jgi:hypothetical protein
MGFVVIGFVIMGFFVMGFFVMGFVLGRVCFGFGVEFWVGFITES